MNANATKSVRNRNWNKVANTYVYTVNEGENSSVPIMDIDMLAGTLRKTSVLLLDVDATRLSAAALNKRIASAYSVPDGHTIAVDTTREIEVSSADKYHVTADTMRKLGTTTPIDGPCIKYSVNLVRGAFAVASADGAFTSYDYMSETARVPEREVAAIAREVALGVHGTAYVQTPLKSERVTWYLDPATAKANSLTDDELEELKNSGSVRIDQ